ncbi:peptidase inhibitor family I36 protein [Streptomyces longwoodensis]|uniref:peptidase inhibitor family I36 protein n=2 Tax=Streptomyces longwoodensis TaxID=68231 RepID=UPI002ED30C57
MVSRQRIRAAFQAKGETVAMYGKRGDRNSGRTTHRQGGRTFAATLLTCTVAALSIVVPNAAHATAQSFACDSGDLCVYTGIGTGSRCSWSNADPDWYSGSVACSWADDRNVVSAYNHGTSSAYAYVVLYGGANYTGWYECIERGSTTYINDKVRSHRWRNVCA